VLGTEIADQLARAGSGYPLIGPELVVSWKGVSARIGHQEFLKSVRGQKRERLSLGTLYQKNKNH
jgi:hypothetical protein